MNFHQDNVLGIVVRDNRSPQEVAIGSRIQPTQKVVQMLVESIHVDVGVRQCYLIGIEGREGLQFHKFRMQLALGIAHQPEVYLHKHWVRRFVWNLEFRRNGFLRLRAVFGTFHQLTNQFLAIFRHPIDQFSGEETGSLGQAKLHMRATGVVNPTQKRLVFVGSKGSVELFAKGGDHDLSSLAS